jgi:hypothetical protein
VRRRPYPRQLVAFRASACLVPRRLRVIRILRIRKQINLVILLIVYIDAKVRLKLLVLSLYLSICLWIESGA